MLLSAPAEDAQRHVADADAAFRLAGERAVMGVAVEGERSANHEGNRRAASGPRRQGAPARRPGNTPRFPMSSPALPKR